MEHLLPLSSGEGRSVYINRVSPTNILKNEIKNIFPRGSVVLRMWQEKLSDSRSSGLCCRVFNNVMDMWILKLRC